ncbi:MAG: lipopolysaccharide biosynthesis regulator YciM [Oceanicoccus sp.]|jgi:lipopolysaccharide biosynthesis regulator YciM
MQVDVWQLLLVFSAIAIGWLLGRRNSSTNSDEAAMSGSYYKGLNYLFNDHPDAALDTFIDRLEVNNDTFETHIAVGNLMRRKGEVERAIRIHQNLLSRPSLPMVQLHQAHLELARDYISAGLLDRAESLLKDLSVEAPELKTVAMRHLLEIYQDEKEWQQAIDVAKQLLPKRAWLTSAVPVDKTIGIALAHYCCELAQLAIDKHDYQSARTQLKQSLTYDRGCVRASLLAADIESRTGHYNRAIKSLRKVREQDAAFVPETVQLIQNCFKHLGNQQASHDYLLECLESSSSATILLSVVADIQAEQGNQAASSFLSKQLKQRPSLRGLARLVELHIANSSGTAKDNLDVLQLLIAQLMQSKPQYQCHHCGFAGKRLHWLCPSCKQWGQIKNIRGAEGG